MSDNHILLTSNQYEIEGYPEANYTIKILNNILPKDSQDEFQVCVFENLFAIISHLRYNAINLLDNLRLVQPNGSYPDYQAENSTAFEQVFVPMFDKGGMFEKRDWQSTAYWDSTVVLELNVKTNKGWKKIQLSDNTYPINVWHELQSIDMATVKDKMYVQNYQKTNVDNSPSTQSNSASNTTSSSNSSQNSEYPSTIELPDKDGKMWSNPIYYPTNKKFNQDWDSHKGAKKPIVVKVKQVVRNNDNIQFMGQDSQTNEFFQIAKLSMADTKYFDKSLGDNALLTTMPMGVPVTITDSKSSDKSKSGVLVVGWVKESEGQYGKFLWLSVNKMLVMDEKSRSKFSEEE